MRDRLSASRAERIVNSVSLAEIVGGSTRPDAPSRFTTLRRGPFAAGFGFSASLSWVAFSIGTNYLFERSSLRLFLIDGGYHVVRFTLMGAVFGLLG
jgi:hypothetical protein